MVILYDPNVTMALLGKPKYRRRNFGVAFQEEFGRYTEAAKECRIILDIVESAHLNEMPVCVDKEYFAQEIFTKHGSCCQWQIRQRRSFQSVHDRAEKWYFLTFVVVQQDIASDFFEKGYKAWTPSSFVLLGTKLCSIHPNRVHEGIKSVQEAIEIAKHEMEYSLGPDRKFLGIYHGTAAGMSKRELYLKGNL
ncbi:hypothetical protein CR513_55793, partial [Mucuna pruriens]